jgi:large subunit ribosomal protein L2
VGNNFPLEIIPPSTRLHCVELFPDAAPRSPAPPARVSNWWRSRTASPSSRCLPASFRYVNAKCRATIGEVGNSDHNQQSLGKAGRKRWLGVRPTVRGVAMNPVDHPNGGGQGKSKGGGGRQQLVSPWGQLAKGFVTRRRSKPSNSLIIAHHNGRKPRGQK